VRIVLLLSFAALLGCGGKPEPAVERHATPAPSATPTPADQRPVIVAFGDSLTAGFGVEPGSSYPDFLQKERDRRQLNYRVVNEGVSGDTTSGGLERLASALSHKPEVLILELGANDGLRGIPVETTRDNLDQMIGAAKKAGARVLLAGITLPRNYGPDYIRRFDRIYPELAKKHEVPLIPFLLEGVATQPRLMQPDALHPTAEGCRIVAETVARALVPMLGYTRK